MAREGYVNLLPAQAKASANPGDSLEMLRARREFLEAGHYAPLREAVVAMLRPLGAGSLLDIGCGEGWYTSALKSVAAEVAGLDIAKPAMQMAAKRYKDITWLVAIGTTLPLAAASADVVVNIFTQHHVGEIHRVLAPSGYALVVSPAPAHLLSLRAALFDEVRAHEPGKFVEEFGALFAVEREEEVRFDLRLAQPALGQLLMMTPYAWKARLEKRQALEASAGLVTEAAFSLLLLRKN